MPTENHAEIGLIGLAVMGQNLVLNLADHGYRVAVYNRTTETTRAFLERAEREEPSSDRLVGAETLEAFVAALERPRKIILLVKAGKAVDAVIDQLAPLLDDGDVIVDGGNSEWSDTRRREADLAENGLRFVGSGVSGGEEGARYGPSLMPGGTAEAWETIRPFWEAIAAKVDPRTGKPLTGAAPGAPVTGGEPCTAHLGADGAGHYVKMVHNGIEYGDMQLIGEAYYLLRHLGGLEPAELAGVFDAWNDGDLDSFLIEITAEIFRQPDPRSAERPFVDAVLDAAGQKGTGKWTSIDALEMGVPAPTIAEAVFARCLSALKDERLAASERLAGPTPTVAEAERDELVAAVRDALYCSKICSYAQGFAQMQRAQREHGWSLDLAEIARIWRGGCIIRARFLQKITEAYRRDPALPNLLLDPYFNEQLGARQAAWRRVVALAAAHGVPCPAFMSALAYYDGYRAKRLPADLLQAQRDYFGAHTYERVDEPRGKFFHVDWPDPARPEVEA